jgi:hypothetical protein
MGQWYDIGWTFKLIKKIAGDNLYNISTQSFLSLLSNGLRLIPTRHEGRR